MITIKKEYHFSSAHQLRGLPDAHPCSRLHGHNYVLTVYLCGMPNEIGFVQDYRELDKIKKYVDDILDHRNLNDIFPDINTTVENMCVRLYDIFKTDYPLLSAVELSETPKTNCRYEPKYI
jgi:6-pyruvoyltetrahydropterin/6-carboxytetrahydropterin synthase